jgi:hypothetical protein
MWSFPRPSDPFDQNPDALCSYQVEAARFRRVVRSVARRRRLIARARLARKLLALFGVRPWLQRPPVHVCRQVNC